LFSKEEVFPEDGAWCDLVPMDSVVAYVFIPISSMPLPAAAGVSAGACRGRFLLAAEDPGNDREDLLTLKAMVAAGLIGLALTASGWGEDRTKLRILTHILSEEGYSIGVADDSGTLIDKTGAGFDAIKPGPMESLRQQLAVSDAEDGKGETRPRDLAITDMEGLKITAYPLGKHGTASRHMVTVKECDVASRIRNRREGLKLLSRFISSIAHEIKNPLTGIAAGVQYLAKKMQSGIREDETVEFILSEINRLNRIVDDLYKVAKPPQLALVRIDLNETVSKSLICMSEDITKKRLTVMQELNKALPELEADPDRLQQILINIIKNAIEASPEGGTLAIETFSTDSRVGIRVTDQGAGIGPEDRERIFEPFFSTKERGSGLGLCISQRIVDEHGGSIRVESPEGGGTSFVIELPTGR
jgi:signal transduction histidine kinase